MMENFRTIREQFKNSKYKIDREAVALINLVENMVMKKIDDLDSLHINGLKLAKVLPEVALRFGDKELIDKNELKQKLEGKKDERNR